MGKPAAILVLLLFVGLMYRFLWAPAPASPPNPRVNDGTYALLERGMTEADVGRLLGEPHAIRSGKILNVPVADSADLQCTIEELPPEATPNALKIYEGADDESIRVLFSHRGRKVMAVEYCIGDRPVVYKGELGVETRTLRSGSTRRIVSLNPRQEEKIRAFRRAQELQAKALAEQAEMGRLRPDLPAPPPPPIAIGDSAPPAPSTTASLPVPAAKPPAAERVAAPAEQPPAPPPPPTVVATTVAPSALPPTPAPTEPPPQNPPATPDTPSHAAFGFAPALRVAVQLPTGEWLTEHMLELTTNWQDRMYPKESTVYIGRYPDDTVKGIFAMDRGKLQGTSVTLHENGQLAAMANYWAGGLEGSLRLWDQEHRRILYSDYVKNQKHGLTCLFRRGEPWFIQRADKGVLRGEFLVKIEGSKQTALPAERLTSEHSKEMDDARQQLKKLESTVFDNEEQLKKDLADWYKREADRIVQEKIMALRQRQRDGQRQKSFERQVMQASEGEAFWRGVLGRSW